MIITICDWRHNIYLHNLLSLIILHEVISLDSPGINGNQLNPALMAHYIVFNIFPHTLSLYLESHGHQTLQIDQNIHINFITL